MNKPIFPLPGKIIFLPDEKHAKKVVLISVEEHVGHCLTFFELLYEQLSKMLGEKNIDILREAVLFHDVGKKLYRNDDLRRLLPGLDKYSYSDATKKFLEDYGATLWGKATPKPDVDPINITLVLEAYFKLALNENKFPRPFELHTYYLRLKDFEQEIADKKNASIVFDLIRNHHRFQAESVVDNCARHGEKFVHLLYGLIALDHLGSQIADEMVRLVEGNDVQRKDGELSPGRVEFGSWVAELGNPLHKPNVAKDAVAAEERYVVYSVRCVNIGTGEIVEGEFPIAYSVKGVR